MTRKLFAILLLSHAGSLAQMIPFGPVFAHGTTCTSGYPAGVSGLQWWFDARNITGVLDGATITSWADDSGNGHTATKTAGTATYHTNQHNSGAAITFASARFGISGAVTTTGTWTIIAVFKLATTGGDQTITGANGGNGLDYRLVQNNGGINRLQFAYSPFGTGLEGTGTAAADTSWHSGSIRQNGSTSLAFRLDGADDPTLSGTLASSNAAPTLIGATGAGEFLGGQLQVLGLYNRVLTLAEIQAVETCVGP